MIHYIYKIIFLRGYPCGRYYLGKRTYGGNDIAKDSYSGSGAFCKAYFKAYGKKEGDTYLKEIIEINPSAKINVDREIKIIEDKYKTDPLCMNKVPGGLGGENCEAKIVLQYDLDGDLIAVHDSQCKAAQFVGLEDSSGISRSCITKNRVSAGYIWRFSNEPLTKSELKDIIIRSKPIKQYTEDLQFIKQWNSAKEIEETLGINSASIISVCTHINKKRHTAGGYVWCYYNEDPIINKTVPFKGKRTVNQFTKENVFIKEYNSLKEAADAVNGKWQSIQRCCNGGRSSAYGYKWKFSN